MISIFSRCEDDAINALAKTFGKTLFFCPATFARFLTEASTKPITKKSGDYFYEQNSARFFKELFIEQFKFAVSNYFGF